MGRVPLHPVWIWGDAVGVLYPWYGGYGNAELPPSPTEGGLVSQPISMAGGKLGSAGYGSLEQPGHVSLCDSCGIKG